MGLRCSISYQLAYSTKTRYYLYFFFSFYYFLSLPPPFSFAKKGIHPSIVASARLLRIETNILYPFCLVVQFLRIFLESFYFAELINNGQFFLFLFSLLFLRRSYRILIVVGKEIKTGERVERKFIACQVIFSLKREGEKNEFFYCNVLNVI